MKLPILTLSALAALGLWGFSPAQTPQAGPLIRVAPAQLGGTSSPLFEFDDRFVVDGVTANGTGVKPLATLPAGRKLITDVVIYAETETAGYRLRRLDTAGQPTVTLGTFRTLRNNHFSLAAPGFVLEDGETLDLDVFSNGSSSAFEYTIYGTVLD